MIRGYKYNLTRKDIIDLWEFLAHGDDRHRQWLLDAIEAFFRGQQRPPVK